MSTNSTQASNVACYIKTNWGIENKQQQWRNERTNEQTETSLWQHYTTQANNVVYGHGAYKSEYDNKQPTHSNTHFIPLNT